VKRARKPRSDKGTKVSQPVTLEDIAREAHKAGCAVRVSFDEQTPHVVLPPVSAAELERRSEQVRRDATDGADDQSLREDEPSRVGDIALTVLVVIVLVAVIAGLARSAV
jgi:hypothetical protein